ncbi:hypothetical protein RFM68_21205 [Mesorhizobium sp. MSK_1335]|uniref:DUF1611 domain-containing protein n=1 Tax=Mesorhizobium montanum TaxID=3072323 RepID=A0ABU4ZSS5_9HYPH|nr:hypothetical protein [Mesorhizobium sp. MSK_1335]MDX8527021.1 hypothetical protein [Mesorhizobium sp. MSK_1335]
MSVSRIQRGRMKKAKRAFATRRVAASHMRTLITGPIQPVAGDLVLARVDELGNHSRLELIGGRKAIMFPGDEIIVCYGNRYAPDQFEAVIGPDLGPCDLVAGGGIAAQELSRHDRMAAPTKITPLGLVGDKFGRRLNVWDYKVSSDDLRPSLPIVLSLGTSMNAGKTLTATSLVRGFKKAGLKVAALKITGTGSGGDMWIVRDAGADMVLDFTDAGFATTYLASVELIEKGAFRLLNHAAENGCDVAVIEIADGLQQKETSELIWAESLRSMALGTIFASYDAMGAKYGVDSLHAAGHNVLAISGRIGRSPLAVREAEEATGLHVYSPWELQEGALNPVMRARASAKLANGQSSNPYFRRIAESAEGMAGDGHSAQESQLRVEFLGTVAQSLVVAEFGKPVQIPPGGATLASWPTPYGNITVTLPKLSSRVGIPAFLSACAPAEMIESAVLAKTRNALKSSLFNLVQALGSPSLADEQMLELVNDIWSMLETDRRREAGNQSNVLRQPTLVMAHDDPDATIMNFSGAFSDTEHRNLIGRA